MPSYDFKCPKCGKKFTLTMGIKERESRRLKCPKCGAGKPEPIFSTFYAKTRRGEPLAITAPRVPRLKPAVALKQAVAGYNAAFPQAVKVAYPKDEAMDEIDVKTFCEQVSSSREGKKAGVIPEQILEVLGGLANLYLEKAIELRRAELQVTTTQAFVSELVPLDNVLQEIQNCSGVDRDRSKLILKAMESCLSSKFAERAIVKPGAQFVFKPLGRIRVCDLAKSSYFLTYTDPAASAYPSFLTAIEAQK